MRLFDTSQVFFQLAILFELLYIFNMYLYANVHLDMEGLVWPSSCGSCTGTCAISVYHH